jgi:hypothetical protein
LAGGAEAADFSGAARTGVCAEPAVAATVAVGAWPRGART